MGLACQALLRLLGELFPPRTTPTRSRFPRGNRASFDRRVPRLAPEPFDRSRSRFTVAQRARGHISRKEIPR